MIDKSSAHQTVEHGVLLLLVVVASLAFAWLIGPFLGAILWGVIAAIMFASLNARLLRAMPKRTNLAALMSVIVIVAVVIVPAMLLGVALISEAASLYAKIEAGEIDLARAFMSAERNLPDVVQRGLAGLGFSDFDALKAGITKIISSSFHTVAGKAFNAGQSTLAFLLSLGAMLYLTFFLLRDGSLLIVKIERCLPLPVEQRSLLVSRFVAVVRATIKGSVTIAILQGLVGGFIFWFLGIGGALLWGVTMAVFSILPAIGTGMIWVPVSIYLFATGDVWRAVVLLLCGILIINNIDIIVRPILVGRDTRMPDYVVLIATLGGFELLGANGFVIGPVIAALFIAVWEIFAAPPRRMAVAKPTAKAQHPKK